MWLLDKLILQPFIYSSTIYKTSSVVNALSALYTQHPHIVILLSLI